MLSGQGKVQILKGNFASGLHNLDFVVSSGTVCGTKHSCLHNHACTNPAVSRCIVQAFKEAYQMPWLGEGQRLWPGAACLVGQPLLLPQSRRPEMRMNETCASEGGPLGDRDAGEPGWKASFGCFQIQDIRL